MLLVWCFLGSCLSAWQGVQSPQQDCYDQLFMPAFLAATELLRGAYSGG